MEKANYQNELEFEVRDYECDLQGVVNNANFQHYLEHARHKWLESMAWILLPCTMKELI